MTPTAVLDFWLQAGPQRWFRKDDAFDAEFRERFLAGHEAAARGELDAWADTPDGALALVLLLDQFPRNAFRGSARMYATDPKALALAHRAIDAGFDQRVDPQLRMFLNLPLMHSEDLADHVKLAPLAAAVGGEHAKFALHHRGILERFGRFPHRNALLGRTSTPEEEKFLAEGGFGG